MPSPELKMKQNSFLDQVNGSTEATVGKVFEQQMGIDERVLDRLLNRALDQGGDFADLFFGLRGRAWGGVGGGMLKK